MFVQADFTLKQLDLKIMKSEYVEYPIYFDHLGVIKSASDLDLSLTKNVIDKLCMYAITCPSWIRTTFIANIFLC
jgi:hypothetical protein